MRLSRKLILRVERAASGGKQFPRIACRMMASIAASLRHSMQTRSPSRLLSVLDTIQLWHLWVGLFGSLVLFGCAYALLHHLPFDTPSGLVPPGKEVVHWYDFFYFSVVTESTLGYGDLRP